MKNKKKRLIYLLAFTVLLITEVLIALYVHDNIVRPYIGDVIVVILIYCAIRVVFPTGVKLLPLYVFLFALTVEILQYFDFVTLLGLNDITVLRIALGSTFSFPDIVCYAVGCTLVYITELLIKKHP